ncbi:uncharacterized protein LOC131637593 [Vicia villosa]|uniref:uncharacterized protein LOC131637593 n=1 Tax=Vicia villosa TaxID=3911 RepID=UPI00273C50F8|nr:uncharacterized protein LOC131637593 [Vicia villosa]
MTKEEIEENHQERSKYFPYKRCYKCSRTYHLKSTCPEAHALTRRMIYQQRNSLKAEPYLLELSDETEHPSLNTKISGRKINSVKRRRPYQTSRTWCERKAGNGYEEEEIFKTFFVKIEGEKLMMFEYNVTQNVMTLHYERGTDVSKKTTQLIGTKHMDTTCYSPRNLAVNKVFTMKNGTSKLPSGDILPENLSTLHVEILKNKLDAPNAPINPTEILEVTPLQMVTPFDLVEKRPKTMHARKTNEIARRPRNPNSDQISQSYFPPSREEPTKEDSRSNHISIVKIVTQILNENNVTSRIPDPGNPVFPESNVIGHVSDTAGTYVPANNDKNANTNEGIDEMNENVHVSDNKRNDGVKVTLGQDDVSIDHIEIPDGAEYGQTKEKEPEKTRTDKVINLDDLSDDDLVASINPSIARRLMRRKGKQAVGEDSQKKRAVAKPVSVGPKKPWSKVVPKKRKARSSSKNESDSNVAADVNDIHPKKKVSTSKLAASVPEVLIDNISFQYPSSVLRWKFVYQKRLALERELAQNALEYEEIMNLIHEAGLMKTVTQLSKCYEVPVKEFIVNLHEDCGNKETEDYLKVFVRGKCVNFSPTMINKFLERSNDVQRELEVSDNQMCKEITAGQVKTWPVKGKLTVSKLSVKYVILHRIGAANWVSTQHKFTISALLDFVCKRASPLLFHHKLFQGTHVYDVNTTSAGPSKESTIMSKAAMISMLRETCKELESRKLALEILISSLETNESAKSADTDVEEQGEDDGGSDSEIEKEASPDDGTDKSIEHSSSEFED